MALNTGSGLHTRLLPGQADPRPGIQLSGRALQGGGGVEEEEEKEKGRFLGTERRLGAVLGQEVTATGSRVSFQEVEIFSV